MSNITEVEPCPICEAKDAEIHYMTMHIARLTTILEFKGNNMTEDQMKELKELLMKAHRKQPGETK